MKMTAKQRLIPVALLLLTVVSVYNYVNTRDETEAEYQALLASARRAAQYNVMEEAVQKYHKVLSDRPSVKVAEEVADAYLRQQDFSEAEDWFKSEMLNAYPSNPEVYRYGMTMYQNNENTTEMFKLYDTMKDRKVRCDEAEKLYSEIEYLYELDDVYADVKPYENTSHTAAVKSGDDWYFIGKNGSKVIREEFSSVGSLTDTAAVCDLKGNVFYISANGTLKYPTGYFEEQDPEFGKLVGLKSIGGGYALATNGESWRYYSTNTYKPATGDLKEATPVCRGIAAISKDGEKWALLKVGEKRLSDYIYDEILYDDYEMISKAEAVIARQGDSYILLDLEGNRIGDAVYEDAKPFVSENSAAVRKNGKWIFVRADGKETDLGDYEELSSFSHGLAPAKKNGRWGYIDTSGNVAVDFLFREVMPVSADGVTFVKGSGAWERLTFLKDNHK